MCFECKSTKHLINDCPHKDKVEKVNDKVHLTLISGAERNGQAWNLIEVLVKAILDTACSNIAVEKAWMNEHLKMLHKKCREKADKSSRVQIIVSVWRKTWRKRFLRYLHSCACSSLTRRWKFLLVVKVISRIWIQLVFCKCLILGFR